MDDNESDFCVALADSYESLMARLAEPIEQKLVSKTIRELRKYTRYTRMMHTSEDSGLANIWEEFCVQVQGEQSAFYDHYIDLIETEINQALKAITEDETIILWTQTDEYEDWKRYESSDSNSDDLLKAEYDSNSVCNYILQAVEAEAANYTTKRIEAYLDL